MKKLFLISTAVLGLTVVHGQTTFQKTYGGSGNENCYSIIQTTDGGYALCGFTSSFGFGNVDIYILKIDGSANLQWSKTIGGTGEDKGFSIIQTNDNGYAISGLTNSYGAGSYDVYIIKLDSGGNLQWAKVIGTNFNDQGYKIIQTNDGGYMVGGFTGGGCCVYLFKLDNAGILQWSTSVQGGYGFSMTETSDGGFALGGYTGSFGAGNFDMYLVKFNSSGNLQWTKTIGGIANDFANSIIQTKDNGYALCGYSYSFGSGSADVYVSVLDSIGNLQWTKTVGGTNDDEGNSIIQLNDSGFVVTGFTSSYGAGNDDIYNMKFDKSGNLLWTNIVGGSFGDKGNSIAPTSDNGFVVGGYSYSFGMGGEEIYVLKFDSNGSICGNSNIGGSVNSGGTVSNGGSIFSLTTSVDSGGSVSSGGTVTNVCIFVSANEIYNQDKFFISPNPFCTQTTLQTDHPFHNATLTVDNCFGQTVKQIKNVSGQTVTLSRDDLPSGLYFIRLAEENKIIAADKLVITDK